MILTKATDKEVKAETISRIKTLIDKYNCLEVFQKRTSLLQLPDSNGNDGKY